MKSEEEGMKSEEFIHEIALNFTKKAGEASRRFRAVSCDFVDIIFRAAEYKKSAGEQPPARPRASV